MDKSSNIDNTVPGLSSKPFYLKSPKENIRILIVSGLMLLVLSLVNMFLLITLPIYLIYCIYKLKQYKSPVNIQLENAIGSFIRHDLESALTALKDILYKDPVNCKAQAMMALIEYEKGNFKKTIDLIECIPDKYIKADFDLQLKLGECYLEENRLSDAKIIYEKLMMIFPKSQYLKDNLKRLE